jgi:tRNA A37 threonylcarbamoyladenosine dehydratase
LARARPDIVQIDQLTRDMSRTFAAHVRPQLRRRFAAARFFYTSFNTAIG